MPTWSLYNLHNLALEGIGKLTTDHKTIKEPIKPIKKIINIHFKTQCITYFCVIIFVFLLIQYLNDELCLFSIPILRCWDEKLSFGSAQIQIGTLCQNTVFNLPWSRCIADINHGECIVICDGIPSKIEETNDMICRSCWSSPPWCTQFILLKYACKSFLRATALLRGQFWCM